MRSFLSKVSTPLAVVCLCILTAAAANAQKVIAILPVTASGDGAVDLHSQLAYIPAGDNASGTNAQVAVINEKTSTVAGYINLATTWVATSAALNLKTGLLYVGTENGGLFAVNPKTGATVAYVNVNAASVAVNPVTNIIYASDFESNLYVIDGATNNIVTTIPIEGIQNIAVNPATNRIYAALESYPLGKVAVIDGSSNQIIAQPTAGAGPSFDVAVDPFRNVFYSSDGGFTSTGTATVYSGKTNTQTTSVSFSGQPAGIVQDPVTDTVYVANYTDNDVEVINGHSNMLSGSFAVGSEPEYMTDDPINKLLYIDCSGTDENGNPVAELYVVKTP